MCLREMLQLYVSGSQLSDYGDPLGHAVGVD
jgi:hypothetical protein